MSQLTVELSVQCVSRCRNRGAHHENYGIQSLDEIFELAIPRGLATGRIIVCVFEVSVARRFRFSAP